LPGPWEVRCPGCGAPTGDTAQLTVGRIRMLPGRVMFRCGRQEGGCGRRWLTSDGWYLIDGDDGYSYARPWHQVEPLEEE